MDNGFRGSASDLPVGQFADEAHCTDRSRLRESALLFGLSVVSLAEIRVVVSCGIGKGQRGAFVAVRAWPPPKQINRDHKDQNERSQDCQFYNRGTEQHL